MAWMVVRSGEDMPEVPQGTPQRLLATSVRPPELLRAQVRAGLDTWEVEGDLSWLDDAVKALTSAGFRLEARKLEERDRATGRTTLRTEFQISRASGKW